MTPSKRRVRWHDPNRGLGGGGRVHCGRSRQVALQPNATADARCKRQSNRAEGGGKGKGEEVEREARKTHGKSPPPQRGRKQVNPRSREKKTPLSTKPGETRKTRPQQKKHEGTRVAERDRDEHRHPQKNRQPASNSKSSNVRPLQKIESNSLRSHPHEKK